MQPAANSSNTFSRSTHYPIMQSFIAEQLLESRWLDVSGNSWTSITDYTSFLTITGFIIFVDYRSLSVERYWIFCQDHRENNDDNKCACFEVLSAWNARSIDIHQVCELIFFGTICHWQNSAMHEQTINIRNEVFAWTGQWSFVIHIVCPKYFILTQKGF